MIFRGISITELKELAENPYYQVQRQKSLCGLTYDMIDLPIIEVINDFNKLPCCFTLQSCYGHFVYNGKKDLSYALQVEPDRFKRKDKAILDYREALHIEKIRNEFFVRLEELLRKQRKHENGKKGAAPDVNSAALHGSR